MRTFFCVATTLLAATGVLAQTNGFTINTPSNAVVCQPLLIQWQGGTPPYYLSVLPGNSPTGSALETLGTFNGTSFTWTVNIAAGTSIGLTLRDSVGDLVQSAAFTINPGSNTSCVGQAVSGSAGTATAALPTNTGTTGGNSGSSAAGTTPGTQTTNAGTNPSSTATSGSSTKSNAANPANIANVGTAGLVGAALVALLA